MKTVKEFLIKNKTSIIIGIIFLIVVFFSVKSYNKQKLDELHGKNEILKEQVKKAQDGTAVIEKDRIRLKDSIRLEDIKKKEQLKNLQEAKTASENKIRFLEEESKKSKSQVKDMNLVQVATALNEVYGGNNATATNNSIDAKGNLPYQILEISIDAKYSKEIINEKGIQLINRDSVILIKNQQLKDFSLNLSSAESALKANRDLAEIQMKLNNGLDKENRKLRNKDLFNKILIPLAGAVGVFVGVKTSGK